MKYKVFAFVLLLLLYVSSALAEEKKVAQHKIKATEVDPDPANDVNDGGRPVPGYSGGVSGGAAVQGGRRGQCEWACCGFGYRGYCSECCGSPEEAKAFLETTQAMN